MNPKQRNDVSEVLHAALISGTHIDGNLEAANVADALFAIARSIRYLGDQVGKATGASSERAPFDVNEARADNEDAPQNQPPFAPR